MSYMVDLSKFTTGDYDKGASTFKIALWFFVNALFVRASWNPFMGFNPNPRPAAMPGGDKE